MDNSIEKIEPDNLGLTKKGTIRKRKPKKSQDYFTQETQDAIVEYNNSNNEDYRNSLYAKYIDYPIHKLAENIIHTFKFYYTEVDTIRDLKHEVVTFLLSKFHLYNPEEGKAYSYFGTIAKRYLILYNEKNYKKLKNKAEVLAVDSDETIYNDLITETSTKELEIGKFIDLFFKYIENNIYDLFPKLYEQKVINSLIQISEHREKFEILNKKSLYIYLRELTDISTPQITKVIKKLKSIYTELFNDYYRDGFF